MKLFNTGYIVLLLFAYLLLSCGSIKTVIPNNSINTNTPTIVSKKEVLTDVELQQWPYADLFTDSIPGISLDKACAFLKGKTTTPIIVGVIDTGVDIEHKDLTPFIWKNKDEIAYNKTDDDHNGYIDDIHGWNFLGNSKGNNIYPVQLELTRMIKAYEAKTLDELIETSQEDYNFYQKQKEQFNQESTRTHEVYNYLVEKSKKKPKDRKLKAAVAHFEIAKNYHYNLNSEPRKTVGDNPENLWDTNYGNPDVIGFKGNESHGTHVAGIIARIIDKSITSETLHGIQIMPLRTIPGGDEYDKDVARAIRYAVDNGAKVINMSFGKHYSAHPDWVYDAIAYTRKKDVLLIMGGGNNKQDIDTITNYPNDTKNGDLEFTDNMICVGAITPHFDKRLVSMFSNYGKRNVDIFAPGSKIYSTIPDNGYDFKDGTSMAAPIVSGVAVLIRAYYPNLSASQVKQIIMTSGINVDFEVRVPGIQGDIKWFKELCVSGNILNAYNALMMSENLSNNLE